MTHVIKTAAQGIVECRHVAIMILTRCSETLLAFDLSALFHQQAESVVTFRGCRGKHGKRSVFIRGVMVAEVYL